MNQNSPNTATTRLSVLASRTGRVACWLMAFALPIGFVVLALTVLDGPTRQSAALMAIGGAWSMFCWRLGSSRAVSRVPSFDPVKMFNWIRTGDPEKNGEQPPPFESEPDHMYHRLGGRARPPVKPVPKDE